MRISASEKQDIGLKLTKGKKDLPFSAYKLLAEIIFLRENIKHIAAHNFLVLECNLIPLAENCVGGGIEHISFRQGSLLLDFSTKNKYKEGIKNIDHLWHVYTNPLEPVFSPLLALVQ